MTCDAAGRDEQCGDADGPGADVSAGGLPEYQLAAAVPGDGRHLAGHQLGHHGHYQEACRASLHQQVAYQNM